MQKLNQVYIKSVVQNALKEDLRPRGDITTSLINSKNKIIKAKIVAKQDGIIAGLDFCKTAFKSVGREAIFLKKVSDGKKIKKNKIIAEIKAKAKTILTAERTALNFLNHASGIATITNQFVKKISKKTKICCTRKTTPNLRTLEKYAVKKGGGHNHRYNLSDEILIKDNHIRASNNLRDLVKKAIKTKKIITVEIENIKQAHIYDGVALTKYLFWLKKNFYKKNITEMSASQKLLRLRKENKKFKFLSFPTISGSGPNGAIIHYKATKETNRKLNKGDIYLVDSGGQYEFGTTDVTRTITLDNSKKRIKDIFTRVLKGHIAVANFKIKNGTSGSAIDESARKYLKQIGLNYAHGTGHGVGYFLNVHEGPHAISKNNKISFQKGMIVSNEPGYYEKNKFGIRIENLIYVKGDRNKLRFENLTMAPIDKDLIIRKNLNENEKKWLNNYHKTVLRNLKKFMNRIERLELKKACSAI